MDLEGVIGEYRPRHNMHNGEFVSATTCNIIYQRDPFGGPIGGGDWAPGCEPPRRVDLEQQWRQAAQPPAPFQQQYDTGYGATHPAQNVCTPSSEWIKEATIVPWSTNPVQQPAQTFGREPLQIQSTAHSYKVFDNNGEVKKPIMRLDYVHLDTPEHLQYGGQHTKPYRNGLDPVLPGERPVLAREVFAETLGVTKRPLFADDAIDTGYAGYGLPKKKVEKPNWMKVRDGELP